MAAEGGYVFFNAASCFPFFLYVSNGLSLGSIRKEDSSAEDIAKSISRFVLTAFAVPFCTTFFVFYNACGVAVKGTCAVISSKMRDKFFGHTYQEYVADVNKHIACTVKDLITNYFIGFLCIGYTFDPKHVQDIDGFFTRKIYLYC